MTEKRLIIFELELNTLMNKYHLMRSQKRLKGSVTEIKFSHSGKFKKYMMNGKDCNRQEKSVESNLEYFHNGCNILTSFKLV